MKTMKNVKGAALVEYGLLVGLIAVVAIVAIRELGAEVNNVFSAARDELHNV